MAREEKQDAPKIVTVVGPTTIGRDGVIRDKDGKTVGRVGITRPAKK